VKRFLKSEIGAAVVWVLCSLLLAAVIAPWFFLWGRQLAAAAETGELPQVWEWLGAACGRSRFSRFFDRALLFSTILLMPLLLWRIRRLRAIPGAAPVMKHPGSGWRSALTQVSVACLIAASVLFGLGLIMDATGAYVPKPEAPTVGRILSKVMIPAVAASLVEEWLFRGVLLGLWLRFARPLQACLGTSLLFAFLHFLNPPAGSLIANPSHPLAGFDLLGKIVLHFADPLFFVTDFAALALAGLILAWARVRTGTLWFSIGLHSGWIMAFKAFHQFYKQAPQHPLFPWGVGENLRSGILPLIALLITAWICKSVLRNFEPASGSAITPA
jgi:membrane protease YdiL (CAAX protease family)